MILSPDGHCRPFRCDARGTRGGAGAGIVVLKRLSDALADRDTIHAVIRGVAINNDGAGKAGYTAPSIDGQVEVIATAQALAGVESANASRYIEAHGTGTPARRSDRNCCADARCFGPVTPDIGFCQARLAQGKYWASRRRGRCCGSDQDRSCPQASRNSSAGEFPHTQSAN